MPGNTSDFVKEIRASFDQVLTGFEDALVASKNVATYQTDATMMARTNDRIWRPKAYIAKSYSGIDQTANFKEQTQLSVPADIQYYEVAPFVMDQLELRDALQSGRLKTACAQILASAINRTVNTTAANQGTLVVKRTSGATGFDDVAQCDALMNEIGAPMMDRKLFLNSRDYNAMAGNLAGRPNLVAAKTITAYDKAYVGMVAGFDTFKMDYPTPITASTAATVSITNANQYFVPRATTISTNGSRVNQDNRYQTINITVGSGVLKAGDSFTIAGVNAVHLISKANTLQPKTFRVISGPAGGGTGDYVISPPIISAQGGTQAELQYQNVTATPGAGAVVTILNTVTASANFFWHKDAIEIIPGTFPGGGAGIEVARGTTEQGFSIRMSMFEDIDTNKYKVRCDTFWGVNMLEEQQAGIMLFSQT